MLQSIYRHGRTRRKIGTASDAAKSFELLNILARGQPRVAHVVKTCNTRETRVIIRVPAVIKTWGDAVRRGSLGVCLGQSTVIGRVLRVGITENSVCLAACNDPKAKMLEKSRMVTRKRGIDLREET